MLFSITTLINEHPLRSDTKTLRGWSNVGYVFILFLICETKFDVFVVSLCLSALIASYIPVFVISNK